MSAAYKVYDNFPIPPIRRKVATSKFEKYPLDTMKVGQMIFVEGRSSRSVSAYIARIAKGVPGKFSTRGCWVVFDKNGQPREADEGTPGAKHGVGVWRIE